MSDEKGSIRSSQYSGTSASVHTADAVGYPDEATRAQMEQSSAAAKYARRLNRIEIEELKEKEKEQKALSEKK